MATLAELRQQLAIKGYAVRASTATDLTVAPLITVHTHPLINAPVVLVGADATVAKTYQNATVQRAIARR